MRCWLVLSLLGIVVAGCLSAPGTGNAQKEAISTNVPGMQETLSPAPASTSSGLALQLTSTPGILAMTSSSSDVDKCVDLAEQDLANRLKMDPARITLQKTLEITWPNIAMGCSPGTGQILTKGRVYGYRVWLQADGKGYIYHVGLTGQLILCPQLKPGTKNPLLRMPGGTGQDP